MITPRYQQSGYIEECISSGLGQGYPDPEYVVVDGGSSDGSRELMERHADRITRWCIEKDSGHDRASGPAAYRGSLSHGGPYFHATIGVGSSCCSRTGPVPDLQRIFADQ
ncbi:MAG: glycosyltransferase [Flavobacteriales bacterium]|nr:glycosyltransferase [Flavobacteriales bacterium]